MPYAKLVSVYGLLLTRCYTLSLANQPICFTLSVENGLLIKSW